MGNVNKVIILGRLGGDPETRQTPGGHTVTNFNVATSEFFTDKAGVKQEKTEWHRIVAWNRTAEIAAKYLTKGREVYIEGALQTRSWDDPKHEGVKRYITEIKALSIQLIGSAPNGGSRPDKQPGYTPPEADFDGNIPVPDEDLPF